MYICHFSSNKETHLDKAFYDKEFMNYSFTIHSSSCDKLTSALLFFGGCLQMFFYPILPIFNNTYLIGWNSNLNMYLCVIYV